MAGTRPTVLVLLLAAALAASARPIGRSELVLDPVAVRRLLNNGNGNGQPATANTSDPLTAGLSGGSANNPNTVNSGSTGAPVDCAALGSYEPATNQACIKEELNSVTCTAGEVQISAAKLVDVKAASGAALGSTTCCGGGACAVCQPGQLVTGTLVLTVHSNTERYSAGLWVAEAGQAACTSKQGAPMSKAECPGNRCSKRSFPLTTTGLVNLDAADQKEVCCGDLPAMANGGAVQISIPNFTTSCELAAGSAGASGSTCAKGGRTNLDWCFGWGQNKDKDTCYTAASPSAAVPSWVTRPGAPSKCACGINAVEGLEVFVPTCGAMRPDGTSPFTCELGLNATEINNSANPSAEVCCNKPAQPAVPAFIPTCAVPSQDGSITCAAGTQLNASVATQTFPAGGFQAACCAAVAAPVVFVPTCGQQVEADPASAFPCEQGSELDPLSLNSTVVSQKTCCAIMESPLAQPVEVGLTATGPASGPVNASMVVTMTAASIGPGTANAVLLSTVLPANVAFDGVACTGGASCALTPQGNGVSSLDCDIGAMPAGASVACAITVRLTVAGVFTLDGGISLEQSDLDDAANNTASVTIEAIACPPERAFNPASGRCEVLRCNPCAKANPKVYLVTGPGSVPGNALWSTTYAAGRGKANGLDTQFICAVDGLVGQIGDIAVLWDGSIVVLDTAGTLRYIAAADIPAPSAPTSGRRCATRALFAFPKRAATVGYTGLSGGFASNVLYATNTAGELVTLTLSTNEDGTKRVQAAATAPIKAACDPASATDNNGGTDVTPGPDGNLYRLCARDANQRYSTTRFEMTGAGAARAPTGRFGYVSRSIKPDAIDRLSDAGYQNAASFCTATSVVHIAADVASGSYGVFIDAGMAGIARAASQAASLPTASVVSYTKPLTGAPKLRINGAAVQPVCSL